MVKYNTRKYNIILQIKAYPLQKFTFLRIDNLWGGDEILSINYAVRVLNVGTMKKTQKSDQTCGFWLLPQLLIFVK